MRMLNRVQSYCFFSESPKKNRIIIVSSSSFCPDNLDIPWLGVDNLPLRGCVPKRVACSEAGLYIGWIYFAYVMVIVCMRSCTPPPLVTLGSELV